VRLKHNGGYAGGLQPQRCRHAGHPTADHRHVDLRAVCLNICSEHMFRMEPPALPCQYLSAWQPEASHYPRPDRAVIVAIQDIGRFREAIWARHGRLQCGLPRCPCWFQLNRSVGAGRGAVDYMLARSAQGSWLPRGWPHPNGKGTPVIDLRPSPTRTVGLPQCDHPRRKDPGLSTTHPRSELHLAVVVVLLEVLEQAGSGRLPCEQLPGQPSRSRCCSSRHREDRSAADSSERSEARHDAGVYRRDAG
jgi:hypothetical protein